MPVADELRVSVRDVLFQRLAHVVDAGLPMLAFVVGYGLRGAAAGMICALAMAAAIAGWRIRCHHSLWAVTLAFAIVLLASGLVKTSGEGRSFFLVELAINFAGVVVFGGSLIVNRPLTGVIAKRFDNEARQWWLSPQRLRLHRLTSIVWFALWASHLIILVPLYVSNETVVLGVASMLIIKPSLALTVAWTWWKMQGADDPHPKRLPLAQ